MTITRAIVVIPARDEQDRLASCLRAVVRAAAACAIPVSITVVADRCRDRTADVARAFTDVEVMEIDAANVGAARHAGLARALARVSTPLDRVWIANTDADSIVPAHWLVTQLAHARAGYDVVIGTVRPDPSEYPPALQRRWATTHRAGEPNGHVHGANLGVRASTYVRAGGFARLAEHEDVDLAARLAGAATIADDTAEVLTSARLEGRTPGGYAGYLRAEASTFGSETPGARIG